MYGFPMFSQRESLLKRHENYPFLKRIITGDEKWVVYNNVKRKRSWSKKDEPAQTISKADIRQKSEERLVGEILQGNNLMILRNFERWSSDENDTPFYSRSSDSRKKVSDLCPI
ncbi:histone-lysine N-methyltransferase SETMAR [Trichonephila clavipes]|nr:histone-lysine N-methyltransferase SETMAR [Trichonephila clavipes]